MSQEASGLKQEREKVIKRAFFVASGTLGSRILGLLRDIAMAALFSRSITDAWAVAFRIPNIFRRLFGEGALSASFIPQFYAFSDEVDSKNKQKLFLSSFISYLFITLSVLTAMLWLYTEPLLQFFLSPEYWNQAEQRELTVLFSRIMVGFVFFFSQYACFVGILNLLGRFAFPAAAAGFLNISMLVFTFMPSNWFGVAGEQLAWGVLVGGLTQSAVVAWVAYLAGFRWNWTLCYGRESLRALSNAALSALSGGVLQFATLLNVYFASQLGVGSISAIYWGDRLLELPLSLVAVSLGSALLPTLSSAYQQKRPDMFTEPFRGAFCTVIFLIVPSAVGLYLISEDLVKALFYRGEFSLADVTLTSVVLQIYALCLIPLALSRLGVTALNAQTKYRQTALLGLASLIVLGVCAYFLVPDYGIQGLLYSNLIAYIFNALGIFVRLFANSRQLLLRAEGILLLKVIALSGVMGAGVYLVKHSLAGLDSVGILLMSLFVAALIYIGGALWMRLPPSQFFKNRL